jgi:lipopolysaccharide export system protein LptA
MATVRMAFTFMQQALFATALCMAFALIGFEAAAQTSPSGRVEILNADRLDFDDHLAPGAQRLIGNVRLKHVDALMFCDSAYLYPDQHVRAYGHVAIRQGDTLDLKADRLDYTGEKRVATVAGKVVLSDPGMTLTTEALTYDLTASRATYTDSARIESRRDGNTLTSRNGTYLTALHRFIFSGNVRIEHPERLITADTLQYATGTGVADFIGPTHITQNETHMYCERGTYDTRNNTGRFTRAGRITTQGRTLTGDSLLYDRTAGIGSGWGNVQVADSANDLLVRGNRGIYHEKQGSSMITGRAELLMPMNGDTLFLHADTLFASTDNVQGRNVTARRNVRFFKSDMQGTCDTMRYNTSDSLVRLRGNPMLWSATDQLTGDSMRLAIADGTPRSVIVDGSGFMVSPADSLHWNQVAGTVITGVFRDKELVQVTAEGNAQTAYFAREGKEKEGPLTNLNRADCARLVLGLDSGQVHSVSFITQPEATLWPLEKAPPEEVKLEGFSWQPEARPTDREDIFREGEMRSRSVVPDN